MNKAYQTIAVAIITLFFIGCATQEEMSIGERLDLERQPKLKAIKDEGFPLALHALGPGRPDSAGGTGMMFSYYPLADSSNPIKYITVTVTPYNAVGDKVSSTVGNKSETDLKITGPLHGHERSKRARFGEVWYNHSIDRVHLNRIEVEMMDGTIYAYEDSFHELATSNFKKFYNEDGSSTGYKISL